MTQTIRLEIAAPLAEIILDQPQRRNALSLEMWAALPARVAEANADPAVKVLLLHGGGTGVFAAKCRPSHRGSRHCLSLSPFSGAPGTGSQGQQAESDGSTGAGVEFLEFF